MILVRDVFRLKFGKAREALKAFKDIGDYAIKSGFRGQPRVLTDLVGPYYTLVLETSAPSLAEYEQQGQKMMADEGWRSRYSQFTPFVESGYREIFNIVE